MSRCRWPSALLALAVAACATPAPTPPSPSRLALERCARPVALDAARCATLEVFENRVARTGRRIPIHVLVLPARTERPAPDPIVVLAGGPGFGAASSLDRYAVAFFEPMRARRDVVFIDQRGTGASNPLRCDLTAGAGWAAGFSELLPPDRVRACRARLEDRADLRLYTTSIAMDDVDDVRAALGYARINLYGVSYASLAALQYLRQHPAHVRTLALAGVVTPDQKLPLQYAAGAQAAFERLLADCAADASCHRAFHDPARDLSTILARLATGPVTLPLPGASGERVRLSRVVFVERLRLMLYSRRRASRVPYVLRRAAQDDWVPFVQATSASLTGAGPAHALGMYLSVTCSETIPVITDEDIDRETRHTFVGAERTRVHQRACQEWPRGEVPAAYYAPIVSEAPVLMLSGELDAATPARFATAVARALPNARQILIRDAAHDYDEDCVRDVIAAFVERGSARGLDAGCVGELRRPPFVTP